VFGKEISYGHGIDISHPGQTHARLITLAAHPLLISLILQHGRPLEICDLGETEIDEATFDEYISELRAHYTPEKVCSRSTPMHIVCSWLYSITY
jgi:hypothetical protein